MVMIVSSRKSQDDLIADLLYSSEKTQLFAFNFIISARVNMLHVDNITAAIIV